MTLYMRAEGHFAETRIDDEVVLMNIDTGAFHAVRGTALAIWDMIDGNRSVDDIVATLTQRFSVEADRCRADVDRFLDTMVEAGFVVVK